MYLQSGRFLGDNTNLTQMSRFHLNHMGTPTTQYQGPFFNHLGSGLNDPQGSPALFDAANNC
jgi:hypothetical protein